MQDTEPSNYKLLPKNVLENLSISFRRGEIEVPAGAPFTFYAENFANKVFGRISEMQNN